MPDDMMSEAGLIEPRGSPAIIEHVTIADRRISLDGTWEFLHLVEDYRSKPVGWRNITVPGAWQAQFADLRMRGGTGIYRRQLDIPDGWIRKRVYLRFGAVFHITTAWVNGALVGTHTGGFLPFSFDVTERLVEGLNEIKIRVDSASDDPLVSPEAPLDEIALGKQSWYGPLSGIWQSVWLEQRTIDHIHRARVRAELATGQVGVRIFLAHPLVAETRLEVSVRDPQDKSTGSVTAVLERGTETADITVTAAPVAAWSPIAPNLYTIRIVLERDGSVIDEFSDRFGFRTIETRNGHFYLNGEPLYIRAALDQDYYPETICTTPSTEFIEDEFRNAKELGLNCLRCHIKAPDPRYYEVADRMGLLVWTELPTMGLSTERSRARKRAMLRGIVDRDGNHPSIICWTIINENWSVDLVHDPADRAWLKEIYDWLKSYDPGRLVVDNSPLAPSAHIETDIADYHYYAAFPDNRLGWDRFVQQLAGRASWLFTSASEVVKTGDEPLMCSEFGNWGLPDPESLKDTAGNEPWWFETGHDWGEGVMYPHGVQHRFADWSLGRVFGDLAGFVEAAQWQQFRALKYEIEALRRRATIAGYVITELTDAHWECNGLLDMRRNPRVFHQTFSKINADIVIVPRWTRLTYWAGETANFELSIAHGGSGPTLSGAQLEIISDATQRIALPDQEPLTVQTLGPVELPVPKEERACMRRIEFVLRAADGSVIATNYLDMAVHPREYRSPDIAPIWSPRADLRERFEQLGYQVAAEPEAAPLWVTRSLDERVATHVRQGGRLLLLPGAEFRLSPLFPHWQNVKVRKRTGTVWRGDWASSFGWLHRPCGFSRVPGGPLLDETFDRVLPNYVISGCNLIDFQARVHAGLVVGWVHKPVALAVERSYGTGRFVASTFRLFRDPPGVDPTATVLLDSLLALAMAEGSAASRDRKSVITGLVERARTATAPRSL
jgi:hypothetical protein